MNASFLWSSSPEIPDENKWRLIRQHVTELISRCDWSQVPDALITPTEKDLWTTYRETLLAIPYDYQSPDDVVFPEPPTVSETAPSPALLSARARRKAARATAKAIPNWATWTQADWDTYFSANLNASQVDLVTSLAAARVMMNRQNEVIHKLVKLIIALRDQEMSDLPD